MVKGRRLSKVERESGHSRDLQHICEEPRADVRTHAHQECTRPTQLSTWHTFPISSSSVVSLPGKLRYLMHIDIPVIQRPTATTTSIQHSVYCQLNLFLPKTMLAFALPAPISVFHTTTANRHAPVLTSPIPARLNPRSQQQAARNPINTSALKQRLHTALRGLNRGLSIDPDAETMNDDEEAVEDLVDDLEHLNNIRVPTRDARMFGLWELVYTSSSITRYYGGATGLQKYLPEGRVGKIEQYIDAEDGTCEFREVISFEVPLLGKQLEGVATAKGMLRATSETRQIWEPRRVEFYFLKQFADSWKTLRAFQVADTTYLDEGLRITRGQTGSVNVFRKE